MKFNLPNDRSIMVSGYSDTGEDVMIFTTLTDKQIEQALIKKGQTFIEVYEVPQQDLQYYIYEPCYFNEKTEANILKIIAP